MRKKTKNRILVVTVCVVAVMITGSGVYFTTHRPQNTSAERLEDVTTEQLPVYVSEVDMDNDGLDDQTDLLQGALDYVATKPKYKSKYYTSGYPDDHYGVCTDVVAQAMKAAGYDLMQLVKDDIAVSGVDYNIEEPDVNIDFRRVQNLKVYFSHTAISLSTDIHDVEQWQGGDIVIFEKHIGVVSDRRNAKGVPYVIHHNDPGQKSYEQDILEKRDDIVGHYRIS